MKKIQRRGKGETKEDGEKNDDNIGENRSHIISISMQFIYFFKNLSEEELSEEIESEDEEASESDPSPSNYSANPIDKLYMMQDLYF